MTLLFQSVAAAAPSASEILVEAKAKANSQSKAIFLLFDSPG